MNRKSSAFNFNCRIETEGLVKVTGTHVHRDGLWWTEGVPTNSFHWIIRCCSSNQRKLRALTCSSAQYRPRSDQIRLRILIRTYLTIMQQHVTNVHANHDLKAVA